MTRIKARSRGDERGIRYQIVIPVKIAELFPPETEFEAELVKEGILLRRKEEYSAREDRDNGL